MRNTFFVLLAISFASCTDQFSSLPENFDDNVVYTGVFIRTAPNIKTIPKDVTISFNNGAFSGTVGEEKYPAICEGTYSLNYNIIEFTNGCIWTADFDWSLILSGEWEMSGDIEELTLTKTTGPFTDHYFLKRKN